MSDLSPRLGGQKSEITGDEPELSGARVIEWESFLEEQLRLVFRIPKDHQSYMAIMQAQAASMAKLNAWFREHSSLPSGR